MQPFFMHFALDPPCRHTHLPASSCLLQTSTLPFQSNQPPTSLHALPLRTTNAAAGRVTNAPFRCMARSFRRGRSAGGQEHQQRSGRDGSVPSFSPASFPNTPDPGIHPMVVVPSHVWPLGGEATTGDAPRADFNGPCFDLVLHPTPC